MQAVRDRLGGKERPVCRWLSVNRKLMSYRSRRDDEPVKLRLVALATEHRRYGLRRLTVLLRREGILDNHKRIARIYRSANSQVRKRVRRKLALGRGPVEAQPLNPNDRWSLDFVHDRLRNSRRFRILAVGDDCTRENLALDADFGFSGSVGARPPLASRFAAITELLYLIAANVIARCDSHAKPPSLVSA